MATVVGAMAAAREIAAEEAKKEKEEAETKQAKRDRKRQRKEQALQQAQQEKEKAVSDALEAAANERRIAAHSVTDPLRAGDASGFWGRPPTRSAVDAALQTLHRAGVDGNELEKWRDAALSAVDGGVGGEARGANGGNVDDCDDDDDEHEYDFEDGRLGNDDEYDEANEPDYGSMVPVGKVLRKGFLYKLCKSKHGLGAIWKKHYVIVARGWIGMYAGDEVPPDNGSRRPTVSYKLVRSHVQVREESEAFKERFRRRFCLTISVTTRNMLQRSATFSFDGPLPLGRWHHALIAAPMNDDDDEFPVKASIFYFTKEGDVEGLRQRLVVDQEDPNRHNRNLATPLHFAVRRSLTMAKYAESAEDVGHIGDALKLVALLLAYGASPDIADNTDKTAREIAGDAFEIAPKVSRLILSMFNKDYPSVERSNKRFEETVKARERAYIAAVDAMFPSQEDADAAMLNDVKEAHGMKFLRRRGNPKDPAAEEARKRTLQENRPAFVHPGADPMQVTRPHTVRASRDKDNVDPLMTFYAEMEHAVSEPGATGGARATTTRGGRVRGHEADQTVTGKSPAAKGLAPPGSSRRGRRSETRGGTGTGGRGRPPGTLKATQAGLAAATRPLNSRVPGTDLFEPLPLTPGSPGATRDGSAGGSRPATRSKTRYKPDRAELMERSGYRDTIIGKVNALRRQLANYDPEFADSAAMDPTNMRHSVGRRPVTTASQHPPRRKKDKQRGRDASFAATAPGALEQAVTGTGTGKRGKQQQHGNKTLPMYLTKDYGAVLARTGQFAMPTEEERQQTVRRPIDNMPSENAPISKNIPEPTPMTPMTDWQARRLIRFWMKHHMSRLREFPSTEEFQRKIQAHETVPGVMSSSRLDLMDALEILAKDNRYMDVDILEKFMLNFGDKFPRQEFLRLLKVADPQNTGRIKLKVFVRSIAREQLAELPVGVEFLPEDDVVTLTKERLKRERKRAAAEEKRRIYMEQRQKMTTTMHHNEDDMSSALSGSIGGASAATPHRDPRAGFGDEGTVLPATPVSLSELMKRKHKANVH